MKKSITVVCVLFAASSSLPAGATNYPVTPAQKATAEKVAQNGVPLSELAPNAPDQYVIKRGDTLWAISGVFLKSPWKWPELWGMNKTQIKNPHLIYPGQVLYLIKKDGRATLSMTAPDGTEIRLSPAIRVEALGAQAIPSIPAGVIEPFLSQPLIVEENALLSAPRIVAVRESGRVFVGKGDTAYVRGVPDDNITAYQIFRPARPIKDPVTGEVLAFEAFYLGTGNIVRRGDPATLDVTTSKEEMGIGDRLLPAQSSGIINYMPHPPETEVDGRIASIYGGVESAGNNQIVVINKGKNDGLEIGHTLALWETGKVIADKTAKPASFWGSPETVKLPDERYGTVFVFRVFDRVAYALVMGINRPVQLGDRVAKP